MGISFARLNERQIKMLNMLLEGFKGKLTTSKWAIINKCSQDTALRDINDLVSLGILQISKEKDAAPATCWQNFHNPGPVPEPDPASTSVLAPDCSIFSAFYLFVTV